MFGLGIRAGRLFYAVADGLQIWSVAIAAGDFSDAMLELNVPPAAGPTEISKIVFDDQGRMVLAERPDPTGAYNFHALAREGVGRVLRFAIVDSYPGAPRVWQQIPDEYPLGFPLDLRNGNGGVDIGYDYDRIGRIERGFCGGFLWSTGENLRSSADSSLSAQLDAAGPRNVDGLQGNYIWNIRPRNAPPLKSYFIDYDGRYDDTAARGHMGDLAIWRVCGPVLRGGWMLPGWMTVWQFWSDSPPNKLRPPPPKLTCSPDQQKPGFQCCPKGASPDAAGQCKPWCPSGSMDPNSQKICGLGFDAATYDPGNLGKLKCLGGATPNGALGILGCAQHSPVLNPLACQMGWSKQMMPNVGTVCMPSPQQSQCPAGQQFNTVTNKCQILCLFGTAWPSTQCCAAAADGLGQCCPAGSTFDPKTGICQPPVKIPPGKIPPKFSCAPAQLGKDGTCCKPGSSPNDVGGGCCPSGQAAGPNGICKLIACPPPGKVVAGKCCSPNDLKPGGVCAETVCGPGRAPAGASNACCDASHIFVDGDGHQQCCPGSVANGKCQPPLGGTPVLPKCAPGSTDPNCCASGYKPTKGGACCLASQMTASGVCCPAGQAPGGPGNTQCQPGLKTSIPPWQNGDGGSGGNQCCMAGTIPTASGMCCSPDQVTPAGLCCPAGQKPDPRNRLVCAPTTVCGCPGDIGERRLLPELEFVQQFRRAPAMLHAARRSADRRVPSCQHPGAAAMCRGLYADAGSFMLREPVCQPRSPHLPRAFADDRSGGTRRTEAANRTARRLLGTRTEFCPRLRQPKGLRSMSEGIGCKRRRDELRAARTGRCTIRPSSPAGGAGTVAAARSIAPAGASVCAATAWAAATALWSPIGPTRATRVHVAPKAVLAPLPVPPA